MKLQTLSFMKSQRFYQLIVNYRNSFNNDIQDKTIPVYRAKL